MPSSSRNAAPFAALAALLLAGTGCSSPTAAPKSCQSSSECPANARCTSGTCVGNAPPTARIAVPAGPLQANLVVSFDGSASADPDAGDAIASYAWRFQAVTAPCAPPVVAGSGPAATVRFACAGTYSVELTVADRMSSQAVATKQLEVVPYAGPALLTVGPDVVVDHVCEAGPPRRCTPGGAIALSATLTPAAPTGLTVAWTVDPPSGLSLDANRRVAFSPGPDAAAPAVTIDTDGQAISGDWIFRVEARDELGVVASGATRVSIGNNPPVITKTIPTPDHHFDGTQLTATGEVPFTVTDPDGDDLVGPTIDFHHSGDGPAATFTATILGAPGRVAFAIAVPFTAPADAQYLIGPAPLERSIRLSVSDVNGASVSEVWPIVVGNRPPVVVSTPATATIDHTYDPVALAYRATPSLTAWTDPDGDPMFQVPGSATGDADCAAFDVSQSGVAVARCSRAFNGAPSALATFAAFHSVTQHVQDFWTEATSPSTVAFIIVNRAPAITTSVPFVYGPACQVAGGCCRQGAPGEGCLIPYATSPVGTANVTSRWSDPDGDPIDVRVSFGPTVTPEQPLVCPPSACALVLEFAAAPLVCGSSTEALSMSVTDGIATVSGQLPVERDCPLQ